MVAGTRDPKPERKEGKQREIQGLTLGPDQGIPAESLTRSVGEVKV